MPASPTFRDYSLDTGEIMSGTGRRMKIVVLHEDGRSETLTLFGEWECIEGKYLHRLRNGGFEHFFTPEGFYDGWGGAVNATPATAREMLDTMERKREISD